MATLQLKNITKQFGDTKVIKGIDLDVNDREFVVFVGPSGCGKSTLMRMIAGLESASDGDILIDGKRMNEVGPADRGLAMVFQSYALYPHMTVEGNMGFSMRLAGVPKEERRAKVLEAAKILQLEPLLDRKPKALSGGQRQRVAIARALACEPSLIVLDEAVSALDVSVRAVILELLVNLQREHGLAYIFVSHDLAAVRAVSHRIAVMEAGAIVETGPAAHVVKNPQSQTARDLIAAVPRLERGNR